MNIPKVWHVVHVGTDATGERVLHMHNCLGRFTKFPGMCELNNCIVAINEPGPLGERQRKREQEMNEHFYPFVGPQTKWNRILSLESYLNQFTPSQIESSAELKLISVELGKKK